MSLLYRTAIIEIYATLCVTVHGGEGMRVLNVEPCTTTLQAASHSSLHVCIKQLSLLCAYISDPGLPSILALTAHPHIKHHLIHFILNLVSLTSDTVFI